MKQYIIGYASRAALVTDIKKAFAKWDGVLDEIEDVNQYAHVLGRQFDADGNQFGQFYISVLLPDNFNINSVSGNVVRPAIPPHLFMGHENDY
jgi:hypothetical protein